MAVSAPPAPGRLGVPLRPQDALRYLGLLSTWTEARRRELDELDAAVQRHPDSAQLTRDVVLAMTLWKAVDDRRALLLATWDSGRVGPRELTRLSSLVWGRLDETLDPSLLVRVQRTQTPRDSPESLPAQGIRPDRSQRSAQHPPGGRPQTVSDSGLSVSVPEACRLCDAMTSSLRTRLSTDPGIERFTGRLGDLRAAMQRLRDQIALEPTEARTEPATTLAELEARVEDLAARASRGGDIGGLIGPLEIDAAVFERDLIVGGARRREARTLSEHLSRRTDELRVRQAALTALVDQCVRRVAPTPRYAVPDLEALGEIPTDPDQLQRHADRLDQVARAMQVVQEAYASPIATIEDLAQRHRAAGERAQQARICDQSEVGRLRELAESVLNRSPSPLPVAEALVNAEEQAVGWYAEQPAEATAPEPRNDGTAADRAPEGGTPRGGTP